MISFSSCSCKKKYSCRPRPSFRAISSFISSVSLGSATSRIIACGTLRSESKLSISVILRPASTVFSLTPDGEARQHFQLLRHFLNIRRRFLTQLVKMGFNPDPD